MNIFTLLIFIIILGLVIGLHELGHLIAAKMCNVYCKEYAIGFGPTIFSYQGKETRYSLKAIPLGGYVAMAGEADQNDDLFPKDLPQERTINGIAPVKRIFIFLAGIMMNLLLFIVLITLVNTFQGVPKGISLTVANVQPGSQAALVDISAGDTITQVKYHDKSFNVHDYYQFSDILPKESTTVTLVIEHDNAIVEKEVFYDVTKSAPIGVSFMPKLMKMNPLEAFISALSQLWTFAGSTFVMIGNMFRGIGYDQLSGPVGIYQLTSQVAKVGFWPLVSLTAVISASIGLMNLVPLPILDGGRVFLLLIELVIGKPLSKKMQEHLILASALLILGLTIFIFYQDIIKLLK